MRGFLPETILNKEKHGFGLPFGTWLKSEPALAETVYTNLSNLKKRRMFRDGFIDDLISSSEPDTTATTDTLSGIWQS